MRTTFSLFLLGAFLASVTRAEPENYGQGYDVYTTASGVGVSAQTLFMTWPAKAGRLDRRLVAVDVSQPLAPTFRGALSLRGFPQDLTLSGNRAYVVNGRDVSAIDISRPQSMRSVAELTVSEDPLYGPQGIDRQGDNLWLACRRGGIRSVRIVGDKLESLATLELPGFVRDVSVAGTLLYAAGDTMGLFVVDISRADTPRLVRRIPMDEGCAARLRIQDGKAYVAAGNLLVAVFDLSDPRHPRLLGSADSRGRMSPFFGNYAHDLRVIALPGNAENDPVARPFVVVADGEGGLIVVDVGDSDVPRFAGAVMGAGIGGAFVATGLELYGTTALVVDQSYGVRAFDVSRPEAPRSIGEGLKLIP